MLDRELKRVIARVSVATLIVIAMFAALAVVLMQNYDVGTQPAYANSGEGTPTPTPTPTPEYTADPQRDGFKLRRDGLPWEDYPDYLQSLLGNIPSFSATANDDHDQIRYWNGYGWGQWYDSGDATWPKNGEITYTKDGQPVNEINQTGHYVIKAEWVDNNDPQNTQDTGATIVRHLAVVDADASGSMNFEHSHLGVCRITLDVHDSIGS